MSEVNSQEPEYTIVRKINRHRFMEIERSDGAYYYFPKRPIISGAVTLPLGLKAVARVKFGEETTGYFDLLNDDEKNELIGLILFREMNLNRLHGGAS